MAQEWLQILVLERKIKAQSYPTWYTKIILTWIIDLNISQHCKAHKRNIGEYFCNLEASKNFLGHRKYTHKRKIDKVDFIKIKNFNNSIYGMYKRDISQKKIIRLAILHIYSCSMELVINQMQIRTTLRYYYICTRVAAVRKTGNTKWWACRTNGSLISFVRRKMTNLTFENYLSFSCIIKPILKMNCPKILVATCWEFSWTT